MQNQLYFFEITFPNKVQKVLNSAVYIQTNVDFFFFFYIIEAFEMSHTLTFASFTSWKNTNTQTKRRRQSC